MRSPTASAPSSRMTSSLSGLSCARNNAIACGTKLRRSAVGMMHEARFACENATFMALQPGRRSRPANRVAEPRHQTFAVDLPRHRYEPGNRNSESFRQIFSMDFAALGEGAGAEAGRPRRGAVDANIVQRQPGHRLDVALARVRQAGQVGPRRRFGVRLNESPAGLSGRKYRITIAHVSRAVVVVKERAGQHYRFFFFFEPPPLEGGL